MRGFWPGPFGGLIPRDRRAKGLFSANAYLYTTRLLEVHAKTDKSGSACRRNGAFMTEDVHDLTQQLAKECRKAALVAVVVAPTRVQVSQPGAYAGLAETVWCMPDADEQLMWWWSWGEPICPATQIPEAAKAIARVVTPPAADAQPSMA